MRIKIDDLNIIMRASYEQWQIKNKREPEQNEYLELWDMDLGREDDFEVHCCLKILLGLAEHISTVNQHHLWDVYAELKANAEHLPSLAKLFDYPPYPEIGPFFEVLQGNARDIKTYIRAFDTDPRSCRVPQKNEFDVVLKDTEQVLDEQFDRSQVERVLAHLKRGFSGVHLSSEEQYDLAKQITFINAIGRERPFSLDSKNFPNLTQVSRSELRELADALIASIRKLELGANEKFKAQLKLLAVLRELYGRATGTFIDSTQLTALLMLLKNPQNILVEMDTDISITALLAVMQWVEADGGTVDVGISNRDLQLQDEKLQSLRYFFTCLGIPSSQGTYQLGGINYTSLRNLTLYRTQVKTDGENPIGFNNVYLASSHLIFFGSGFAPSLKIEEDEDTELYLIKGLVDDYKTQGRIVGIVNTLENKELLAANCAQFEIEVMYQIPAHQETKLIVIKDGNGNEAKNRLYLQKIFGITQVILQQFQEWSEFLHLIYPKNKGESLNTELMLQRKELIRLLNEQSILNPLANVPLDEAVHVSELSQGAIWDKTLLFFKEKAERVLIENSLNALHYEFLCEVSFAELLQLNKLAICQSKKELPASKKKAHRYLQSGLDVSAAMLQFSGENVENYRDEFVKNQLKFLAAETIRIIKNNTFLHQTECSILVEQVGCARNLDILVGLLIDYAQRYIPEDQLAQKYAMQPIIHELVHVHEQAGISKTSELKELKKIYLDEVRAELVDDLEINLSWAIEENRGLSYLLERPAVTDAANALLFATDQLKKADALGQQKNVLKNLYRQLVKHESLLSDLWLSRLGQNTRTLIQKTLVTLDGLTTIGADENELNAAFVSECKEEALYELMKDSFNTRLEVVETERNLQKNAQWGAIKKALMRMQAQNNSMYALHELYYFLSNKVEELAQKHSKLHAPVIRLRGEAGKILDTFSQEHKDLFNRAKYLNFKAENLQEKFKGLRGFSVQQVTLQEEANDLNEDFDLVIEGSGSHFILRDFIQYNSREAKLVEQREALKLRITEAGDRILNLDHLRKNALPGLKLLDEPNKIQSSKFPIQFQAQVNSILLLREWISGRMPSDLSVFPEKVRANFMDRALVDTFKFPDLQLDEINKLQDLTLKNTLKELHESVVDASKSKSWLQRLISAFVSTPENMEDWQAAFNVLSRRPAIHLQFALLQDIEKQQQVLAQQLDEFRQQTVEEVFSWQQQVIFLNEKIAVEKSKSGTFVKRISNISELLKFEEELMHAKLRQEEAIPLLLKSGSFFQEALVENSCVNTSRLFF